MFRKLMAFAAAGVVASGIYASATTAGPSVDPGLLKSASPKKNVKWVRPVGAPSPDDNQEHRYIIQFNEEPLPLYEGGVAGLAATRVPAGEKLDPNSTAARAYVDFLKQRQEAMLSRISDNVGGIQILRRHQHAVNAVTVRMTEVMARKVRRMEGVRFVERDRAMMPSTPTSIGFIGASLVHTGDATGVPYQGEGAVVGIIDSGINHEHPSFAATGADGYTVENPLGDGNYLGECATIPGLCNSKLIGAYTFLDSQDSDPPDEILIPGDPPSSDTDGHGSHVASTAAGNVLEGIALPDADGNPSSVLFSRMSGVAPHANIVAYKVCAPSCFFSDIAAAVDQAIADGVVDALNQSIGSPAGSPWESTTAQAFLSARAAGIFVANSAGNAGPGVGTAGRSNNAPWSAGVAATTHDRSYPPKTLGDFSGGDTAPPAEISGRSISGAITGEIVYAGDFPIAGGGDNETQPEQCLVPFPPGTFTANQIVVCDRGTIARVAKGQNVRDGGAGGFILANTDGGATTVNNDPHVIPSIHIAAAEATALRAWLASGSGHTGTITAVTEQISDPAAGDNMAGFSSRGPYTGFEFLAPNIAAPGVEVFAAGAELTQAQVDLAAELYAGTPSENPSVPDEFGQIGGTSMASPHIAGTSLLIRQAHPDWTAAEILSAMMTTGTYVGVKEDGTTPVDLHDVGGGRVQVDKAINAGLVLDETASNFESANPAEGGDPKTLNVAAMVNISCVGVCSWSRTVRATVDGTWTTSGLDPWVSVSPAEFTLAAGETQTVEITAEVSGQPNGEWAFSRALITPADESIPTTHMAVAVLPASGSLPSAVNLVATRDAGSQLFTDLTALSLDGFNVRIYEPAKVEGQEFALPGDSDNSSAFDDLTDGVTFITQDVGPDAQRALFQVLTSESPDLDLFVGVVVDPGTPVQEDFLVCVSATATAIESCDLDAAFLNTLRSVFGENLTFYAVIQNWAPSAPDAVDAFTFASTVVGGADAQNIVAQGPTGALPPLTPFDVRFFWNFPAEPGDLYISATEWYADSGRTQLLGTAPLQFARGEDDIAISASTTEAKVGDTIDFAVTISPNFTPSDRTYTIAVPIPDGLEVDPDSISNGGFSLGNVVFWPAVTQATLVGQFGEYLTSTNADNPACDMPFGGGYIDLAGFGILPQADLTGDTFTATFFSTQNPVEFYGAPKSGLTVTDDGFAFFESSPGFLPFIPLPIPDPTEPNDMLAPFWADWFINFNDGSDGNRIRGISAATAGLDISIIEWDGVELWPGAGGNPISGDFELLMYSTPAPDRPEFLFAYNNLDAETNAAIEAALGPIRTGVESIDGSVGTEYTGEHTDGLIVCFDYVAPVSNPIPLTFSAKVKDIAHGTTIEVAEFNTVDDPGAAEESSSVEISVERLPYEFQGFLGLEDGDIINLRSLLTRWFGVDVKFRLLDPVTGARVSTAEAFVTVTDANGHVVREGQAKYRSWRGIYRYNFRTQGLKKGLYTITASFDDGTSRSIQVEMVKRRRPWWWLFW